jgi:hypothetical protein
MPAWTHRVAGIMPAIRGRDALDTALIERGSIMDRKRIHLAAIVCVFILLGSACPALENQIINGEFDTGIEPWQKSAGDGFTIEVVQDADLSGANALKIDVLDAAAQESIMVSQGIFVLERGAKYHIGFTAKANADRQIGVIFERDGSWSYAWHEWIDLKHTAQPFIFECEAGAAENVSLCFILKHSLFPLLNSNENIDVYIDNVYIFKAKQPAPEPNAVNPHFAHDPFPPDGAIHQDTWATLSWSVGSYASSHDTYFGYNFEDVYDGSGETIFWNMRSTFFLIGFPDSPSVEGLVPGTTYYWRIDEVNDLHPDSPWKGDVWSFTISPRQAFAPDPVDGAKSIDPNVKLSWTEGFNAKSHIVYFGDNFDDVNNATGGMAQIDTSYALDPLELGKTYYWRIDELDGYMMHKGNVWSFTTVPSTSVSDLNLAYRPQPSDGVMYKETWITCSWSPGHNAASHEVYFGENFDDVYNGTGDTYWGNKTSTFFVYGFPDFTGRSQPLVRGLTYYWRIDEVNDLHPDSPWKGNVWSFWLAPYTAYDPAPADGAKLIDSNVTLSWTAGFNAKLHTLYLGENSADVEAGAADTHKGRFAITNFCLDTHESGTTYYWRVDEFDGAATHKGKIWSFSTVPATLVLGGNRSGGGIRQ